MSIMDTMPNTREEFNALVDTVYQQGLEAYQTEIAEARAKAEEAWEKLPKPADWSAEKLTQEKAAYLLQAVAVIPQPPSHESVVATYQAYEPQDVPSLPVNAALPVDIYASIYKVGDNYWNVAEAKWVPEPQTSLYVIELGGEPTVENLRENLLHYATQDPRIELGPEIMTEAELFACLREKRNELLSEYDVKVAQLDRLIRLASPMSEGVAYTEQRHAWDEYAVALCDLPEQNGAPWDGGGEQTPWPVKPE